MCMYVCVCVALIIQRSKRMRRITSSVVPLAAPHFSIYLIHGIGDIQ